MKLQLVANYEKKLREPVGDLKKFPKKFLMGFLYSVTVPKNVKRGTLWDFLTSIVLQNAEKMKGGPFGAIHIVSKKSHSTEKKWGFGGFLV